MSFLHDPFSPALTPDAESAPSSAARVMGIPELLESILFYLPTRDLLLAQRVNRTFQSVICNTRSLQENLFLRGRVARRTDDLECRETNPLLHPEHAPWFNAVLHVRKSSAGKITPVRTSSNNCLIRLPCDKPSESYACFIRKEASWRRMLPTQPPPKSVWLVRKSPDILDFFGRRPRTDHDELLRAREGEPITMEQIFNTARLWCERAPLAEGFVYHVDILLVCSLTGGSEDVEEDYIPITRMETRLVNSA